MAAKRKKKAKQPTKRTAIEPRAEAQVFEELRKLAQCPGFIHALAVLAFRSNVVTTTGEFTKEDFLKIYRPESLLRTEANLLLGLMLDASIDCKFQTPRRLSGTLIKQLSFLRSSINQCSSPAMNSFLRH